MWPHTATLFPSQFFNSFTTTNCTSWSFLDLCMLGSRSISQPTTERTSSAHPACLHVHALTARKEKDLGPAGPSKQHALSQSCITISQIVRPIQTLTNLTDTYLELSWLGCELRTQAYFDRKTSVLPLWFDKKPPFPRLSCCSRFYYGKLHFLRGS